MSANLNLSQHHFAASWLERLSEKLVGMKEFAWAPEHERSVHKSLYQELFSAKFQRLLVYVSESRKGEFFKLVEKHLYKFEDRTQFPVGCLCAFQCLGKDAKMTQDKLAVWVDYMLESLRHPSTPQTVDQVAVELLTEEFLQFTLVMEASTRNRLADGLGENLGRFDEQVQRHFFDKVEALPNRIEELIAERTAELNEWLLPAPRCPPLPTTILDVFIKMEQHPLVRHFKSVKDANKKEAFMIATALSLQSLRTRFKWMGMAEPELERVSWELQQRLFFVPGTGHVMELWLASRLKKYNQEAVGRWVQLSTDVHRFEDLRSRFRQLFPEQPEPDPEEDWLSLDGPSTIGDTLTQWLTEPCTAQGGFFCPRHVLARETINLVLNRFGRDFEVDPAGTRVRLGPGDVRIPLTPAEIAVAAAGVALPAGGPQALAVPSPPPVPQALGSSPALVGGCMAGRPPPPPPPLQPPGPAAPGSLAAAAAKGEVDNLVDFLLQEALEKAPPEQRARIVKVGHGLFRLGGKELTLHTANGSLYVYRVGDVIRHEPIGSFLESEGILPAPLAIAPASGSGGAVDNSAVSKIAQQSAQISAGLARTTPGSQQLALPAPFGQNCPRPELVKTGPKVLEAKKTAAAAIAMKASREMLRRIVNFDNERVLRKLVKAGTRQNRQWTSAWKEHCASSKVADADPKKVNIVVVTTFLDRQLAKHIDEDWVKPIIEESKKGMKEKKDKKEKSDKKDKKEKERHKDKEDHERARRKRKASDASGDDDEAGVAGADALGSEGVLALAIEPHTGGSVPSSRPGTDLAPPGTEMAPPPFPPVAPMMPMPGMALNFGPCMGGMGSMMGPMGMPPPVNNSMFSMPPSFPLGGDSRKNKRARR